MQGTGRGMGTGSRPTNPNQLICVWLRSPRAHLCPNLASCIARGFAWIAIDVFTGDGMTVDCDGVVPSVYKGGVQGRGGVYNLSNPVSSFSSVRESLDVGNQGKMKDRVLLRHTEEAGRLYSGTLSSSALERARGRGGRTGRCLSCFARSCASITLLHTTTCPVR